MRFLLLIFLVSCSSAPKYSQEYDDEYDEEDLLTLLKGTK